MVKQKTVAIFLAQEGIEAVRNIRDTNLLQGRSFNFGITGGDKLVPKESSDLSKGFMLESGGPEVLSNNMTREITINEIEADKLLEVTVKVKWKDDQYITLVDYLSNWK